MVHCTNQRIPGLNFPIKMKIVSILANSADSDEMPHDATFHLRLHCLLRYSFMSF